MPRPDAASQAPRPAAAPTAEPSAPLPSTTAASAPAPAAAPLYLSDAAEFRAWLAQHGASARALLVGFHKVGSGVPSMTWPQSVDEALCMGWIDGVRTGVDALRYTIRFTPRRPGSHWSAVNVARMAELIAAGRVTAAGLAAWAQRDEARTARASYEQPGMPSLPPQAEAEFRTHAAAWAWFNAQAPSYRKRVIWNLLKAKQPATVARHLARLIEASAQQRRL
ncbi:MAG: bacteriocin-protection protein [Burkholderiales bacterium PBB5]|nr:MAG: bacteriocin-protection protein [Burkholderiales bacterium PBB5]